MGKIILVTGGARSGKSTFAEETARKLGGNVVYIATSKACDDEMIERIKKHRSQRPEEWVTIEAYKDMDLHLKDILKDKDAVLLDCITIMVSNLMLEKAMDWEGIPAEEINRVEAYVKVEIEKLIKVASDADVTFIIVTNELGMGVVPPYELGRAVRDIAGRANQMLARAAEEVYLCVSGIPVRIK
jgi:Adenosyl cobinamide kinase/adenosyl cobinamide phosphate guanylyltransferase